MNWLQQQLTNFSIEGIWGIVFLAFALFWLVVMVYYWAIFSRLAFYRKKKEDRQDQPPVSVVIAAKNEYSNLNKFLPLVLQQDYPDYEVIVVNDASGDDSVELLEDMKREYPCLKVINLHENVNFFKGKKFPLSVGIRSATHEHLLLTDADCRPENNNWIAGMIKAYKEETCIVLGYGKYEEAPGLANLMQRYDTIFTAMQYLSFALAGMPYMGVGRNLSYKKEMFSKTRGFSSHYKLKSGDDDLFINKIATKENTELCLTEGSTTISKAAPSLGFWFRQKRRHLTTGKFYRFKHKFWLGLFNISRLLLWGTLIALLLRFYNGVYVIAAGALLLFTFMFILKRSMNNLRERNLLLISPLLDIMLLITYLFINFANLIRKPDKWK